MRNVKDLKFTGIIACGVLLSSILMTSVAIADSTTLYFVRHAEKQNVLTESEGCFTEDCVEYKPGKTCCTQELSDLGLVRRDELADRLAKNTSLKN